MTIESRELFELCKQVYEATGWYGSGSAWRDGTPLYSSDYLLEKLPRSVPNDHNGGSYWFDLCFGDSLMWHASYDNAFGDFIHDTHADTPLKALLKLTLKLHEEKIL